MKPTKLVAAFVVGGLLMGSGAAWALRDTYAESRPPASITVSGSGRLPDYSATDWVTYGDFAVLVTVVSEQPHPLDPGALETGEGIRLREVTLRVDKTLWSSPRPETQVPATFDYLSYGWLYKGDQELSESATMAGEKMPRLEVGHDYVMALDYVGCADSALTTWRSLGEYSMVPADDGVIGQGELEGRAVTPTDPAYSTPEGLDPSLRDSLVGRHLDAIAQALAAAKPTPESERPDYPAAHPCDQK